MSQVPANNAITRIALTLLPWAILVVMISSTWLVWEHEHQAAKDGLRAQFDFALRETVGRVDQRVMDYEQILRGVQSLYATTPMSNRDAMHKYVANMQLDANFSGIQAIGLVDWVGGKRKAAHLTAMRAAGFPNYAIEPDGSREVYAPIIQREPFDGPNRAAPGYDVWADSVRREALEKARDSGMAAISGKVQLKVDADSTVSPGFIMYLPIYAPDLPHDSVAQRRTNLVGWVYASFHMNDFMASLYGNLSPGLTLSIHDGTDINDLSLLYRTANASGADASLKPAAMSANEYMVVAGHNWTLSLHTQDAFASHYGRGMETVTAAGGVALSLLMALLTWLIINGRQQAMRLAAAMTEELRATEQRFHRAVDGAQEGIWELDLVTDELYFSPRMSQMLGYTEAEMPPKRDAWNAITHPDDLAHFDSEMVKHFKNPAHPFDVLMRMRHRDGSWRCVQNRGTATRDAQGRVIRFSGTQLDITERKRLEEEVQQLAFYDPLTRLSNRRLLDDRLTQTLTRAKRAQSRMALMFIDLDRFKPINDEHGHEAGDWVLEAVARRIESCLRATDTAARMGGDEFLVLLPEVQSSADALAVAEKIRMELERPFVTPSALSLRSSASIGIAVYPDHANNVQDLLRLGDRAMYQAKKYGGNTVLLCDKSEPDAMDDISAAGQSIIRLSWKAAFACGHPDIDREHRELFNLSNVLLGKVSTRAEEPAQFYVAFDALLTHVEAHFAHEELILHAQGYENLAEHTQIHRALLSQASSLRHRVGTQADVSVGDLVDFLVTEVVLRHMLIEDRKFQKLFIREDEAVASAA